MYSNETVNYQLPQFAETDKIDPVADFNPAFGTIDRVLEENRVTATSALDGVNGAMADAERAQQSAQKAENAAVSAAKSASNAAADADLALQEVENLQNEVEELQDAQTAQGTQISTLSNEYHVFVRNQTLINASQDNINAELQTKTTRHDTEIESLNTAVAKNTDDIANVQQTADSNKAELLEKITENEGNIETLQISSTEHRADIESLHEMTNNIQRDLDVAETAINKNTEDIKNLQDAGGASEGVAAVRNDLIKVYGSEIPENVTATNIALESKVSELMSYDNMTFDVVTWDTPAMGVAKGIPGPTLLVDNHIYIFNCRVDMVYQGLPVRTCITGYGIGTRLFGSQYVPLEPGVLYDITVTINFPSNITTGLTTLLIDASPLYGGTPSNKPTISENVTVVFIGNRR